MNSIRIVAVFIVVAVCGASAFAATPNPMQNMSSGVRSVTMNQQNGSTQDGTASVKDVSGGILVTISLKNEPANATEPAHIHKGTCAQLDPAPYKPLQNVVNGMSTTMIKGISVADLSKDKYAINVHQSAANLGQYVSCGDI